VEFTGLKDALNAAVLSDYAAVPLEVSVCDVWNNPVLLFVPIESARTVWRNSITCAMQSE
jgi:hypothetical protein